MVQLAAATESNANKVSGNNDDCFLNAGFVPDIFSIEMAGRKNLEHMLATNTKQSTCFAIFTGQGRGNAGEAAAHLAAEDLKAEEGRIHMLALRDDEALFRRYAIRIKEHIGNTSRQEPALAGMKATFVCLCLQGRQAVAIGNGGGQVYLFRQGQLQRLIAEHPPAVAGANTGTGSEDCYSSGLFSVQEHDRLLLCSAGLAEAADELVIMTALSLAEPRQAVTQLTAWALGHATGKSVTATVIDVSEEEAPRPAKTAKTVDYREPHQIHPHIEYKSRIYKIEKEKPKINPADLKFSRLDFWKSIPVWLQNAGLILFLLLLLLLLWIFTPQLFG